MNSTLENHLKHVLHHVYINPLERCNLRCQICYTKKTSPILSEEQILSFISRYQKEQKLESITFCGGEVFTLPYFPHLVNELTNQGILIQIITNGTVDTLSEFSNPNSINLIVSLDGLEDYHDKNRGKGNFKKSISFLQKAFSLGFHAEIFSIVTKQNYPQLSDFEAYLGSTLGQTIPVTYHPRKPPFYLSHHPVSNILGTTDGFDFLDKAEMTELYKNKKTFPPKQLGCYQIAVTSDGKIYGCCEGVTPIGTMEDEIRVVIDRLETKLEKGQDEIGIKGCLGCPYPDFVCGMKHYLQNT